MLEPTLRWNMVDIIELLIVRKLNWRVSNVICCGDDTFEFPFENKNNQIIDITEEQPYLKGGLHHIEPKAVLEIVAFDSTEIYVLADDEELVSTLKNEFPNADSLEKYVF